MKELFSVNAEGHQMSEPQSLSDLAQGLDYERSELGNHREGVARAAVASLRIFDYAAAVVRPSGLGANATGRSGKAAFAAAHARYTEAMYVAMQASKAMSEIAARARDELEAARAQNKTQSRRPGRR